MITVLYTWVEESDERTIFSGELQRRTASGRAGSRQAGDIRASGFDKNNFQISPVPAASNIFLDKALFSYPAPLTLGASASRCGQIRNFARRNEDIGLQKNMKSGGIFRFQLRAEFLNPLNRGTLGGIQTSVISPQFGQVTSISGNARSGWEHLSISDRCARM